MEEEGTRFVQVKERGSFPIKYSSSPHLMHYSNPAYTVLPQPVVYSITTSKLVIEQVFKLRLAAI